jgi:hypothetical protein
MKIRKKVKKISKSPQMELRRKQIKKAFPAVKQLAKKYGLNVVNACILQLKNIEKKRREFGEKKNELSTLEKELKNF